MQVVRIVALLSVVVAAACPPPTPIAEGEGEGEGEAGEGEGEVGEGEGEGGEGEGEGEAGEGEGGGRRRELQTAAGYTHVAIEKLVEVHERTHPRAQRPSTSPKAETASTERT
jgi:hypothetical protein